MKYFFITCILLIHFNSHAKKLSVHDCPTEFDASNCSKKCEKLEDVKVEFDVDIQRNKVLKKLFHESLGNQIYIKNDCKIFNDDNWVCIDNFKYPNKNYRGYTEKMIDGVYFYSNNYVGRGKEGTVYTCAK